MERVAPAAERAACPAALTRAMTVLRERAGMDIAFTGRVEPDGRAMRIVDMRGAQTRALDGLTIANGAGLGGKSLAMAKPVRVASYLAARGITHVYDHAVRKEQMETVAALPVRVGTDPRFVIYLANRSQTRLGDRWLDPLVPLLRDLERELTVSDEVDRRLRSVLSTPSPAATLSPVERRGLAEELSEIAEQITDPRLADRVRAVRRRLSPRAERLLDTVDHPLTPREVDVLAQVALGHTNAAAAEALGLLPNTVKSYLKTAMRKLGASNRVQAIEAARVLGLLG